MTNKILIVGFACLSLAAVAQSDSNGQKKQQAPTSNEITSPRDAASGQATGKRMHKPMTSTAEVGITPPLASKEQGTNRPVKTSAADDWQAKSASSTPAVKPVSTGDVDGDRKAKVKPAVSNSQSEVKSPRDLASGQASGKQAQQQPAPSTKPATDQAPKK
jgi:hypothetical protein